MKNKVTQKMIGDWLGCSQAFIGQLYNKKSSKRPSRENLEYWIPLTGIPFSTWCGRKSTLKRALTKAYNEKHNE